MKSPILQLFVLTTCLYTPTVFAKQICDDKVKPTMPDERYVLFGDENYVRDRVTGLEWTRCAVGQIWHPELKSCIDARKKQVTSWFQFDAAKDVAIRFVDNNNQNDWRLPSRNELMTLVEHSCKNPAINRRIFPNAPSWRFWTSTQMNTNDEYAWVVNFQNGETATMLKSSPSFYVRLVRGNPLQLSKPEQTPLSETALLEPWDDGIHDLTNPELTLLQPYQDAIEALPSDSAGHPDWAQALRRKLVQPRMKIDPNKAPLFEWTNNIVYKNTANMPWVIFPHKTHSQWLACENCHEQIFASDGSKADITMASIYTGNHCGACHGRVAFNINTCERCHSVPYEDMSENAQKMLTEITQD
ncbi:DUF1566 domain-containing protein [Thalassotalea aquiviva]|uniref:Lcl domain-containing protein n=1 Tax=Thalassotalea aquiviva TaxID=3242415 RepID=UPI00352A9DBA